MLQWKPMLLFALAATCALGAASYRFGDSAHAIGMLSTTGGNARHPFHLKPGKDHYTLIMTGRVLPPFKGDIDVVLEGIPTMNYRIHRSEPVIDLGVHRRPVFDGSVLRRVRPGDKLALWVDMSPQLTTAAELNDLFSTEPSPPAQQRSAQSDRSSASGSLAHVPLSLCFYDSATRDPLLKIPVNFADRQSAGGRHGAHH